MPKGQQELAEWFNLILLDLWDATAGGATTQCEAFKGITRFSRFLLSEISRYEELEEKGERSLARRGLAIPLSVLDAWIWNILDDCREHAVAPPKALLRVIYRRLGCNHLAPAKNYVDRERRQEAVAMVMRGQSLRDAANLLGVNASTVMRWTQEGSHDFDKSFYRQLRRATNVNRFYPPHWRIQFEKE